LRHFTVVRAFLPPRQAESRFHGAGIAPSFTGERNLPNMSKSTFKFLKCQGKERKRAKGTMWDLGLRIADCGFGKSKRQRAKGGGYGV
jgi:hypothetical protein